MSNMNYFVPSAVLCISVCFSSVTIQAQQDGPSSYVLGGKPAKRGEFPFQAAVLEKFRHICSGSIVNDRHVLTAASCVTNSSGVRKSPSNITVGVGYYDLNYYYVNDSSRFNVSNIYVHESFKLKTLDYNIAVIRIKGYFQYKYTVFPVPLATVQPLVSTCNASGWGAIWTNPPAPDMQWLFYTSLNITGCSGSAGTQTFCASSASAGLCQGDVGGPLVCEGELVGVASNASCGVGQLTQYTSVVAFMEWIQNIVTNEEPTQLPSTGGFSSTASPVVTLGLLAASTAAGHIYLLTHVII